MEHIFTFINKLDEYSLRNTFDPKTGTDHRRLFCSHTANPKSVEFLFDSLIGLLANIPEVKKNNPFGEFLTITETNLVDYLNKYGFLFDWESSENFDSISLDEIFILQNRFKHLLTIFNNISTSSINYKELLLSTFFLIGQEKYECKIGKTTYTLPSIYSFQELRNSIPERQLNNITQKINNIDGTITTILKVENVISNIGYTNDLNILDYQNVINDESLPDYFKDNLYLYINKPKKLDLTTRMIIDYIYIFFSKVGVFDFTNTLVELDDKEYSLFMESEELKRSLILISKKVLAFEINKGLIRVTPTLNIETLQPDWNLPDLISAFYFTLFYSNPNIAMYKICENIGCNSPFYVQRSNTIKIYCCESCKNAASQRRYRNKQKNIQ